jgi:recombinational DNA repair protein RecT
VCEADEFDFQEYPRSMRHKVVTKDSERGAVVGAWSALHMPGVSIDKIEFMTVEDIEKLRNHGKSANSPAWKNWYDEMAKAKVTKRNFKYMATEDVMNQAISIDDELDMGERQSLPENGESRVKTAAGQDTEEAQFEDVLDSDDETDDASGDEK